jgi:Protein of unknown function (DUF3634)
MEYAVLAVVIVLVGVVISQQVTARRRVFVIQIRNGVPILKRGKLAQAFVVELADVLNRHRIRKGAIYGVPKAGRVSLRFSRTIPQAARQSLRNVWSMHAR